MINSHNTLRNILFTLFFVINSTNLFCQQLAGYATDRIIISLNSLSNDQVQEIRSFSCHGFMGEIANQEFELWNFVPGMENDSSCLAGIEDYIQYLRIEYPGIYVQPDYLYYSSLTPNDSLYSQQWNLQNSGQNGGLPNKGLNIEVAWDLERGGDEIIVGILDTGIDWDHPDLINNIWQNLGEDSDGDGHTIEWDSILMKWVLDPGDLSDNLDQDGNGYINDLIGWNFLADSASGNGLKTGGIDPNDDNSHGTHVAGIIGASGNNHIGVSGICWNIRLMPLKFMNANGAGYTSDAIEAIQYALQKGVPISNNSWGGAPFDSALFQIIDLANSQDHLFVAAAGNDNLSNNDLNPVYPASYDLANIISVGAHDSKGDISFFSNIGPQSVDIFAPGGSQINAILSTMPGGGYGYKNGTSMAAPHVSGIAALMMARFTEDSSSTIKRKILESAVSEDDMTGKCLSSGRLDAQSVFQKESEKQNGDNKINNLSQLGNFQSLFVNQNKLYAVGFGIGVVEFDFIDSVLINYSAQGSVLPGFTGKAKITSDSLDNIWLATSNAHGVFRFNGQYWDFFDSTPTHNIISITNIEVDSTGKVWVGGGVGAGGGSKSLHSYYQGLWRTYNFNKSISDFLISDSGIIWIGTYSNGLYKFNSIQDSVELHFTTSNSGLNSNSIVCLADDDSARVWIGNTSHGLAILKNGVITYHPSFGNTNPVENIVINNNQEIWLSNTSLGGKVYKLVSQNSSPVVYSINSGNQYQERISSIYIDDDNQIWAGGKKNIFKFSPSDSSFNVFSLGIPALPEVSLSLATDPKGNLWSVGIQELAKYNGNIWEIYTNSDIPSLGNQNFIGPIKFDNYQNLWFVKAGSLTTKTLYHSPNGMPQDSLRSISIPGSGITQDIAFQDSTIIWMGLDGGLISYFILEDSVNFYDSLPLSNIIPVAKAWLGNIRTLEIQGDSILWLGAAEGRLIKYNILSDKVDSIFQIISASNVFSDILLDDNNVLWICSRDNNGVITITGDSVKQFLPNDYGLQDPTITSAALDKEGNIWLGSLRGGLLRYKHSLNLWNSWTSQTTSLPIFGGASANENDDPYIHKIIPTKTRGIFILTERNGIFQFFPDRLASFAIEKTILCQGDTLTFFNTTKHADRYVWRIDSDSVSSDSNLVYIFEEPGIYEVSLEAVDSVLGNRNFSQYIEVTDPIHVDLGPDSLVCGQTIFLQPQVEGESYFWTDLGGNILSSQKYISIQQNGDYVLSIVDECGFQDADTLSVQFIGSDCVWPGDIDRDGRVNLVDFQFLALAHGDTGSIRVDSSTQFIPLDAPQDWIQSTLGINHKFADLDGNGIVELDKESSVIAQNFNFGHNGINAGSSQVIFRMESRNSTYELNDTIFIDFFVESTNGLVDSLHSVIWALDLNIIPESTPFLETNNSQLDTTGNLLAKIAILEPDQRRISFGIGRLDAAGVNTQGYIGGGGITITIDDIIEDPWTFTSRRFLTIDLKDIVLRKNGGQVIPVNPVSYNQSETVILEVPWKPISLELWLEGAFRTDSLMSNELRQKNFIPIVPVLPQFSNAEFPFESLPSDIVDWVELEFRIDPNQESRYKKLALVKQNGTLWDPFAYDSTLQILAPEGHYYILARHRNHLPVISRQKVFLSNQKSHFSFAEQNSSQGFKPLTLLSNGKWALWAGDADKNGRILPSDKISFWEKQHNLSGYLESDFNLDGIVDSGDILLWRKNLLRETIEK